MSCGEESQSRRQSENRAQRGSSPNMAEGRSTSSWPRNNWTEAETREVMEVLVREFVECEYSTVAYSKSKTEDLRFANMSFYRPPKEIYNKVQNLRQRFFTPHGYLLRWANPVSDVRVMKRAEKGLTNIKTRESIHGIFESASSHLHSSSSALTTISRNNISNKNDGNIVSSSSSVASSMAAASSSIAPKDKNISSDFVQSYPQQSILTPSRENGLDTNTIDSNNGLFEKSVHYYCDIFNRVSPDIWAMSLSAYKRFAADQKYQRADLEYEMRSRLEGPFTHARSKQRNQRRNSRNIQGQIGQILEFTSPITSPSMSLTSTITHTPSTAFISDMGSDIASDMQEDSDLELLAVAGHSWHKFLCNNNRWAALGLRYSSEMDWFEQEAGFLAQHVYGLVPFVDSGSPIPFTVVPSFTGTLDSANIEAAIRRSGETRNILLRNIQYEIGLSLRTINQNEQIVWVSMCILTDRQSHTNPCFAMVVCYGHNLLFPHNDPMLGRISASSSDVLWHEYSATATTSQTRSYERPLTPRNDDAKDLAFGYLENGKKYCFFARRKGPFFEISARQSEWAPLITPTQLDSRWNPRSINREELLNALKLDSDKVIGVMVEMFGLRQFCIGFYDSITSLPPSTSTSVRRPRRSKHQNASRRMTDDPALSRTLNRNSSISRIRRIRRSADSVATQGLIINSPTSSLNNSQQRPIESLQSLGENTAELGSSLAVETNVIDPISAAAVAAAAAAAAATATMGSAGIGGSRTARTTGTRVSRNNSISNVTGRIAPYYLSPQNKPRHSFSSMQQGYLSSMSLPNSPYFDIPFDNFAGTTSNEYKPQHSQLIPFGSASADNTPQLFPPLSDTMMVDNAGLNDSGFQSSSVNSFPTPSVSNPVEPASMATITARTHGGGNTSSAAELVQINMYPHDQTTLGTQLAQMSCASITDATNTPPMSTLDPALFNNMAPYNLVSPSTQYIGLAPDSISSHAPSLGQSPSGMQFSPYLGIIDSVSNPTIPAVNIANNINSGGQVSHNNGSSSLGFQIPMGGDRVGDHSSDIAEPLASAMQIPTSTNLTSIPAPISIGMINNNGGYMMANTGGVDKVHNLYLSSQNPSSQFNLCEEAARSLSSVFNTPEFVAQIAAQPSPVASYYNISADVTPPFESYANIQPPDKVGAPQASASEASYQPNMNDNSAGSLSIEKYFGHIGKQSKPVEPTSNSDSCRSGSAMVTMEPISTSSIATNITNITGMMSIAEVTPPDYPLSEYSGNNEFK